MAEARLEEDEEESRELRDAVAFRNRNPAPERSDRNKPEHRLLGQGPLSSIRAVIKRTSRASSQSDPPRDRRRPEITILSAEPLASGSWFPGGSGAFPPPPPPPQQIWGGRISADAQPPPSYDQVIKEKTQEQAPPPSATPHCTNTATIATQTDFIPETESSIPECTTTSQDTKTRECAAKQPAKPPRPSLPLKAKLTQDHLTGIEFPSFSQEHANPDGPCAGGGLGDPFLSDTEPLSSYPPPERVVSDPSLDPPPAQRPTPLPRTKANLQPLTREVKVQTLVRLKDDSDGAHVIPAGGELSDSSYLKELLDVFGEADLCQSDGNAESEDGSMSALHSHRDIRAKIQAFEKQVGADGSDGGLPQPCPRTQLPKPPVVTPKPALAPKPANWNFWEENSAASSSSERKHSPTPDSTHRPTPFPAPRLLPPLGSAENGETAGSSKPLPSPSLGVSVLARAKSFIPQEDQPSIARPPVQAKPSLPIQSGTDFANWSSIAGDAPAKPLRTALNLPIQPSISRRPTVIRVPSQTDLQSDDGSLDTRPPLTPSQTPGESAPSFWKPSLPFKPTFQAPAQDCSNSGWSGSSTPAVSLPPRPTGGKVLPPRPPPAKVAPGRPPPPQAGGPRYTSFQGGRGAASVRQRPGQGTAKKGPVLPPRPSPGHTLYNKYTLGLPHAIAEFDYHGTAPGELTFQRNEVLLLLEQRDSKTFECQVGDNRGTVQKSYMKIITPLFDASDFEAEAADSGQTWKGNTGLKVQALHDFTPEGSEELGLRAGDIVSMVEQVDSDWYCGTCRGQSGFFPVSYVKVLSNVPVPLKGRTVRPVTSAVSGPTCVARFDFDGEQGDDLTFSKGDVICLKEYMGQEWAQGELRGRVGIFPLNFVEVVEDLPSPSAQPSPQMKIKLPGMESHSKSQDKPTQSTGGQWAVALYDFTAETEQELSLKQGDRVLVTEHVDADWCSGKLRGNEGFFPAAFVEFCTEMEGEESAAAGTGRARALYDFTSENDDELSLRAGDILTGIKSVDDDWFIGDLRGRCGLVPKNYVQLLQDG